jgi:hypothetical protein
MGGWRGGHVVLDERRMSHYYVRYYAGNMQFPYRLILAYGDTQRKDKIVLKLSFAVLA